MIWLTQWLCPNRHAAIAVAWDDQEDTAETAERRGEELFARGILNRWCGICSGQLHVENHATAFATLEEAMPYLKAIEGANLLARTIIGGRF